MMLDGKQLLGPWELEVNVRAWKTNDLALFSTVGDASTGVLVG